MLILLIKDCQLSVVSRRLCCHPIYFGFISVPKIKITVIMYQVELLKGIHVVLNLACKIQQDRIKSPLFIGIPLFFNCTYVTVRGIIHKIKIIICYFLGRIARHDGEDGRSSDLTNVVITLD